MELGTFVWTCRAVRGEGEKVENAVVYAGGIHLEAFAKERYLREALEREAFHRGAVEIEFLRKKQFTQSLRTERQNSACIPSLENGILTHCSICISRCHRKASVAWERNSTLELVNNFAWYIIMKLLCIWSSRNSFLFRSRKRFLLRPPLLAFPSDVSVKYFLIKSEWIIQSFFSGVFMIFWFCLWRFVKNATTKLTRYRVRMWSTSASDDARECWEQKLFPSARTMPGIIEEQKAQRD